VARKSVAAPSSAGVARCEVDIPYGSLALPEAKNTISAEVRGKQADRLQFAQVLPWLEIDLTPGVTRAAPPVPQQRRRQLPTVLAAKHRPGDKPKPEERSIEVLETLPPAGKGTGTAAPSLSKLPLQNQIASVAAGPWVPLSEVAKPEERVVYFATNRNIVTGADGRSRFGTDVATDTTFGSCLVNIPLRNHHRGDLETPGWLAQGDPSQFFAVDATQTADSDQFLTALGPDDIVIFVHGFLTTFDDAVLRAAQLRFDTNFPGQIISFSWPSYGDLSKYPDDQKHAADSVDALAGLLKSLIQSPTAGKRKLHIIAHSLGNRVTLNAIYLLLSREGIVADDKPLGQIILAAPDVGASDFNYLVDYAIDSSARVTYYFSNLDSALRISQKQNSYQPVGLYPYFERGLDTICADHTDTSFIGHSYYADSDRVLSDLQLILTRGLAPADRMPPLAGREAIFGHNYWSFSPTKIKELAAAPAKASP
jgi:esterase/lipase superfamily enzyme